MLVSYHKTTGTNNPKDLDLKCSELSYYSTLYYIGLTYTGKKRH